MLERSDTKNLRELSEIEQWTVIPGLKQVPGVADVSNFGGLTTQFQLELDPQQLMRFNLSLQNVTDAINANSGNSGGSVLTRGELGYVVRGIGLVQSLDDMGNIVVTQRNGTPIFVRDLGKLKLGIQERHGILGKDDRNDAIEGTVLLLRGENPSRVMAGVHAKVDELNDRLKAEDVQIVPYLDRTDAGRCDVVDKASRIPSLPGIGLVLIVLHPLPRQPAQRADRRHHHPVRDDGRVFILMNHTQHSSAEPAVARGDRLRHHRRWRDRGDGGDPAPVARRSADEPLTEQPMSMTPPALRGGAADLLCHHDHHHRLHAAVRASAHRGEAVLPHGLHAVGYAQFMARWPCSR